MPALVQCVALGSAHLGHLQGFLRRNDFGIILRGHAVISIGRIRMPTLPPSRRFIFFVEKLYLPEQQFLSWVLFQSL